MELTNNLKKTIRSLSETKYRRRYNLFKAEGTKCVEDTLGSFTLYALVATQQWLETHPQIKIDADRLCITTQRNIDSISSLSTPPQVIAVYNIPDQITDFGFLKHSLTIALDGVQDPGNLGTIIRTADWFGIKNIICSHSTIDVYNPKVVQSTMGGIARVNVCYTDLEKTLTDLNGEIQIYATMLNGENIFDCELSSRGVILMGNEGNGVSERIARLANRQLLIPSYPSGQSTADSLNVAIATAITLAEFRRREF